MTKQKGTATQSKRAQPKPAKGAATTSAAKAEGNGSSHASAPVDGPTRDQVAARAFELFLARGGGHGDDVADWLRAEAELGVSGSSN